MLAVGGGQLKALPTLLTLVLYDSLVTVGYVISKSMFMDKRFSTLFTLIRGGSSLYLNLLLPLIDQWVGFHLHFSQSVKKYLVVVCMSRLKIRIS